MAWSHSRTRTHVRQQGNICIVILTKGTAFGRHHIEQTADDTGASIH